jgi:hypothetical protein
VCTQQPVRLPDHRAAAPPSSPLLLCTAYSRQALRLQGRHPAWPGPATPPPSSPFSRPCITPPRTHPSARLQFLHLAPSPSSRYCTYGSALLIHVCAQMARHHHQSYPSYPAPPFALDITTPLHMAKLLHQVHMAQPAAATPATASASAAPYMALLLHQVHMAQPAAATTSAGAAPLAAASASA